MKGEADPVVKTEPGDVNAAGTANVDEKPKDINSSVNSSVKRKASSLDDDTNEPNIKSETTEGEKNDKRVKLHSEPQPSPANTSPDPKTEPELHPHPRGSTSTHDTDNADNTANPAVASTTTTTSNQAINGLTNEVTNGTINKATNETSTDNPTRPNQPYKHCHHATLSNPLPSTAQLSLFLTPSFRDHFCRCPECFPRLARHRVLLEEEDVYEPPLSEDGDGDGEGGAGAGAGAGSRAGINGNGILRLRTGSAVAGAGGAGGGIDDDNRSIRSTGTTGTGTGSLLDRGEAALMSGMDRVRAIGTSFIFSSFLLSYTPFVNVLPFFS